MIRKGNRYSGSTFNLHSSFQIQNLLNAVHPSSSGSQDMTTTMDEYPERPPSVVLEAVTLKHQASDASTCATSSSLTLPTTILRVSIVSKQPSETVLLKKRRFSETIHSSLIGSRRRRSVTIETVEGIKGRRRSYQPTKTNSVLLKPPKDPVCFKYAISVKHLKDLTHLLIQRNGESMRRLSEIITEFEIPARSSLGQLYSFARRESVYIARKKLAGLKDWALDLLAKLKSKQGMAIRRETRATKLVATVMAVFLACWLPFFTLNMIKVYYLVKFGRWPGYMEGWFHWFSALGYLNSSLNFFIYSAINKVELSKRLTPFTFRSFAPASVV